jgi:hypothetical protein
MRMNNGTPPVDRTRKNRKELKRSKIGKTLAGLPREDYLRGGEGASSAETAKHLIDLVGKFFCDNATSAQVSDYIWDEQNMWQMGTFPSVSGYQALRPLFAAASSQGWPRRC